MTDLRYDVVRLERDDEKIVARSKTLDECRRLVGEIHAASALPYIWAMIGMHYVALTMDGASPTTPLVARHLLRRAGPC